MPSAITTRQCQGDQGSRSNLAGTSDWNDLSPLELIWQKLSVATANGKPRRAPHDTGA
jgi:hypothetical protein